MNPSEDGGSITSDQLSLLLSGKRINFDQEQREARRDGGGVRGEVYSDDEADGSCECDSEGGEDNCEIPHEATQPQQGTAPVPRTDGRHNTGPKGVIADHNDHLAAVRAAWFARGSEGLRDGWGGATSAGRQDKQVNVHVADAMFNKAVQAPDGSNNGGASDDDGEEEDGIGDDDDDDDDFLARHRAARIAELRAAAAAASATVDSAGGDAASFVPSDVDRLLGYHTTLTEDNYLSFADLSLVVERERGNTPHTVLILLLAEGADAASRRLQSTLATLATAYPSTLFGSLTTDPESLSLPAFLFPLFVAYRGGDVAARLSKVTDLVGIRWGAREVARLLASEGIIELADEHA